MIVSKRVLFNISLLTALSCSAGMVHSTSSTPEQQSKLSHKSAVNKFGQAEESRYEFYAGLLFLKPYSDDLKYATFVSGTQPYYQSWHYQAVKPDYSPGFELGMNYHWLETPYDAQIKWTHLNTSDSSSKQASTNTDLITVEFVGPPYEMSPPVFGIKRVDSQAKFNFDSVLLNMGRLVQYGHGFQANYFFGLNFLHLNHKMTTTFGDYAGTPATPYSYALPPDPSFSFKTANDSEYNGVGPDVGVNVQYQMKSGFGFVGQVLGSLTVGVIKTSDKFTSTSARLTELGIGVSHQEITAPNATQVVPGVDGKLGLFYHYSGSKTPQMTIEAGYRLAAYMDAISTVNPNTLVQPGTIRTTPEFATGTMAIVSTDARSRSFSYSGPYINLKMVLA